MNKLTVDIIIPTYKPDEKFERLLRGIRRQTYPIQTIYIINTRSGHFPWETTGLDSRIVVKEIDAKEFDHGGTRKMAAALSDADVFVCMTQDAVPADKEMVEHLVQPFEDEQVACTYGRQLPGINCDTIEQYTRSFNYPPTTCVKDIGSVKTMGIKAFFCSDVCAAYRRAYYKEQGGFIEKAIFNEDMIMAGTLLKAGYKCVYAADAKVIHSHNYTAVQQLRRNFDLAVSQKDNPSIFADIQAESEGVKLIKQTMTHLMHIKKPWLVPKLIWKSGFKYIGFKLGQNYKRLPQKLVVKLSSNPKYWNK